MKVKEHLGNSFNDLMDELAKKGGTCEAILDVVFILFNTKIKFFPYYNKIPLVQNLESLPSLLLHFYLYQMDMSPVTKDTV